MLFSEKQKSLVLYSTNITLFSPLSNLYQLCRIHSLPFFTLSNFSKIPPIIPQQILLRYAQLNFSLFTKDHISPYLTFGIIGILQGVVYGHATTHFANQLKISKPSSATIKNIFRGSLYAFNRDTISQGIPFLFVDKFRDSIVTPLFPTLSDQTAKWGSLITLSVGSTILSHPFHNLQIIMQVNSDVGYKKSVEELYRKLGVKSFYRGVESRIIILLITNIFNEIYLKDILR